jgi:condensin complex subunit 1
VTFILTSSSSRSLPCSTYDGILPQIFAALTRVVVASPLPEAGWYSAAESALTAIYALHTAPEYLSAAMLKHMATSAFAGTAPAAGAGAEDGAARSGNSGGSSGMDVKLKGAPGDSDDTMDTGEGPAAPEGEEQEQDGGAAAAAEGPAPAASEPAALGGASQQPQVMHSVAALSRFFFALGHVALQHLVSAVLHCTAECTVLSTVHFACGLPWLIVSKQRLFGGAKTACDL